MKNILITFSGGRTSAFMAHLINQNPKYKDWNKLFLFANTGKEKEETLVFIDKCSEEFSIDVEWLEAWVHDKKGVGTDYRIVNYTSASRKGEPFQDVIKKYGLPSKLWRHCTRELKEAPIHKYAKEYFKGEEYYTAVGIRADEKHRLKKKKNYIYPLAEFNIDERFIRSWWETQSFDLELKDYEGNCDLCFLKSKRKKLTILKENPSTYDWWAKMENEYSKDKQPIFDVYRDLSLFKLLGLSKKQFRTVEDQHELRKSQNVLFDTDMDMEFDCFCKST
jgi:hypothetical protein